MTAVIDYRAGNLTSVMLALEHIGEQCEITSDPSRILSAQRVVFPGVGAAGAAMRNLASLGLTDVIRQVVQLGKPFLGICLGTQIILDYSEEDGGTECLGLLSGAVKRFAPTNSACKIPHMGWNAVRIIKPHPLFEGIEDESEFYFVHSYYPTPSDSGCVFGVTEYADVNFASVIGQGNIFATQFHPERSGRIGLRLLSNFVRWDGRC
ncbi:MAG: imidazole glycerol phosphate synthase subunit HisH [Armatimonadota bacterium]